MIISITYDIIHIMYIYIYIHITVTSNRHPHHGDLPADLLPVELPPPPDVQQVSPHEEESRLKTLYTCITVIYNIMYIITVYIYNSWNVLYNSTVSSVYNEEAAPSSVLMCYTRSG